MTSPKFMNVVRFKLKSECVDKYFEAINNTNFEGMTQRYIAKTGMITVLLEFGKVQKPLLPKDQQCSLILMKLGFMEELSPELGITDPVSGNIVSKVGFHDKKFT